MGAAAPDQAAGGAGPCRVATPTRGGRPPGGHPGLSCRGSGAPRGAMAPPQPPLPLPALGVRAAGANGGALSAVGRPGGAAGAAGRAVPGADRRGGGGGGAQGRRTVGRRTAVERRPALRHHLASGGAHWRLGGPAGRRFLWPRVQPVGAGGRHVPPVRASRPSSGRIFPAAGGGAPAARHPGAAVRAAGAGRGVDAPLRAAAACVGQSPARASHAGRRARQQRRGASGAHAGGAGIGRAAAGRAAGGAAAAGSVHQPGGARR
mmetsp:Transcript_13652/g.35064  ORF Transcript_13652/g.35064 Transcript_13652/m.35064 type:complete len:263 (+) Transcript_13652:538-1326(+)